MELSLFLFIPVLTCVALVCCRGLQQARAIALAGAGLQLALSVILLIVYWRARAAGNVAPMLFQSGYSWFASFNINYQVGVDGISVAMILLTAFVVLAGVLVSWNIDTMPKEFFFLLIFLSAGAYGFFISLDLFMLFFFLELAVIPKFLLIGIWGSGKKEYSAMKLALMLMGGSALVFTGLVGLYFNTGATANGPHTFGLLQVARMNIPLQAQLLFFPFLFVGFGVFTALFPFHTWVPDGHSSAPTAASMFLAGISMKLGGYGCLRVATFLMPAAAQVYAPYIIALATIAIIYGAFATMMQQDLKYINAYSSVSHCGFVLLGIGMLTRTSITGAVMQMVSHGLMTALFFAAIGMLYSRTHTRMVNRLGGLLKIMPFISTVFVLAGLCSLGLPGLSGFVAEMTIFMGAWQNPDTWYRLATILACASIVVTAVYILRAVGKTVMGTVTDNHYNNLDDARWNERMAAALLLAGIVVVGVAPFWLTKLITPGTEIIIQQVGKAVTLK
ncbi:MAG: NADH-quinone oxidoreductase subunit M [Bacteroidota bacterium]